MLLSLYHLVVLSSYHGFFVLTMNQFSCCMSPWRLTVKWHPKFVSLNNLPIRVLLETQIDRKWWHVCLGQTDSNFDLDVYKWGTDMEYNREGYFGHRRLACRGSEKQTLTLTTQRLPRWHSGWGAVLQIGRSLVRSQLVSLEFFIDIKSFRSHYGHGVDSASSRNEYRCVRPTTLPPSCAVVMKSGPLQACNGTVLPLPLPREENVCDIGSPGHRISRLRFHAILSSSPARYTETCYNPSVHQTRPSHHSTKNRSCNWYSAIKWHRYIYPCPAAPCSPTAGPPPNTVTYKLAHGLLQAEMSRR